MSPSTAEMKLLSGSGTAEDGLTVVCLNGSLMNSDAQLPGFFSHLKIKDKKDAAGDLWRNGTLSAKNRAQAVVFATSRTLSDIKQGIHRSRPIRVLETNLTQFFTSHPASISLQRCAHSLVSCTRICGLLTPDKLCSLISNATKARRIDHARPAIASLSSSFWTASSTEDLASRERVAEHLFDLAMSGPQVAKSMDRVPVYTVSNSSNEFILISDLSSRKSLGIFCFRQQDADVLLAQVKDREPSLGRGARVVQVMLDKVYQLSAEGIAFRFLPDPQQVRHALEEKVRRGVASMDRGFDGIPVFQSGNLILKSRNRRFLPVFFSKEDLDLALRKAFQQQKRSNPALKVNTDIQVASFEEILKQMESKGEESGWGDVVFIPPGTDVNSHLDTTVALADGSVSSVVC